jgi:hypothetical protein
LQSHHQVDMKNVVECQKEFFAYFNALKTYSELYDCLLLGIQTAQALIKRTLKDKMRPRIVFD